MKCGWLRGSWCALSGEASSLPIPVVRIGCDDIERLFPAIEIVYNIHVDRVITQAEKIADLRAIAV